jgi:AraC family chitin signaling transcriptional activator
MHRMILILLGISLSVVGNAQDVDATTFRRFPVQAIQANSRIKVLQKDTQGNIWVGADDGLIRYNGKEVRSFENEAPMPFVKKIIISKSGALLVVHDGGLTQVQSDNGEYAFQTILTGTSYLSDSTLYYPKNVYEDRRSTLWIGENKDVVRYERGVMTRYSFGESYANSDIFSSFSFVEDGYQQLWAVSYKGGLYRYDQVQDQFVKVGLPRQLQAVSTAIANGTNRLWIGADDGVHEVQVNDDGQVISMVRIAAIRRVSKLQFFGGNDLLISSASEGLFQRSATGTLRAIPEITDSDIVDFHIDQQAIWLASNENVEVLHVLPLAIIPATQEQDIPSITLTEDNAIVINEGREVSFLKKRFDGFQMQSVFTTPDDFFINKTRVYKQTLWLAGSFGRVFAFDLEEEKLQEVHTGEAEDWLVDLHMDKKGTIWIFDLAKAPALAIDANLEVTRHEELSDCWMAKTNDQGRMIAAGRSQYLFIKKDQTTDFRKLAIPFRQAVTAIYDFDFLGDSILLATDKGLFRIDGDVSGDVSPRPTLIHGGLARSVAVASDRTVWFADAKGLVRLQQGEFSYFDQNNGLPSKRITERGILIDQNDELWVATGKGVGFVAKPDLLELTTPVPQLTLLKQDGAIRPSGTADLGTIPSGSVLEFSFALISFPAENVLYQATLKRRDGATTLLHEGGAYFSLLGQEPGRYELAVRAKQLSGQGWSAPRYFYLTIQDPFYKTTWFVLLMTFLVGGLFVVGARLYNRQLKRSNQRLDELVTERTQLLNAQKDKLLAQQEQLLKQKNDLLEKNKALSETKEALVTAETRYLALKDEQLQRELALKDKQLTTHALTLIQKNQALKAISESMNVALRKKDPNEIVNDLQQIVKQLEQAADSDEKWDEFKLYFEQVYTGFYSKLKLSYPELTPNDLRHCALIRLNLSLSESASLLGISSESVRMSRFRIQKKLDLHSQQALIDFLLKL